MLQFEVNFTKTRLNTKNFTGMVDCANGIYINKNDAVLQRRCMRNGDFALRIEIWLVRGTDENKKFIALTFVRITREIQ